jgi:acetyl esterase/lipase
MTLNTLKGACLTFATLVATTCAAASESIREPGRKNASPATSAEGSRRNNAHLSVHHRIQDVLRHHGFEGHANLLLPWDDRAYDEQVPLSHIAALLPYHNHVEPAVVVNGLNRIIDDVGRGETVFHRFYTARQLLDDPSKRHTGLFFFRGKPGAPFAVVAPGGGFAYVGSVHEGFPHAIEINQQGLNAFVLKYRAGQGERVATEDLAAAVSYILRHASELQVDPQGYSAWGSSAGARMVANVGSHGLPAFGGAALPGPATVVMAYTAHTAHVQGEPPTFVVVGEDDGISPPAAMERRVAALRDAGTPVEYLKFPGLGHGFGVGTGTPAQGWVAQATRFWLRAIRPQRF